MKVNFPSNSTQTYEDINDSTNTIKGKPILTQRYSGSVFRIHFLILPESIIKLFGPGVIAATIQSSIRAQSHG